MKRSYFINDPDFDGYDTDREYNDDIICDKHQCIFTFMNTEEMILQQQLKELKEKKKNYYIEYENIFS